MSAALETADFVAQAQQCHTLSDVELCAMRRLERAAGFDTAIYVELWPNIGSSASINKEGYKHLLSLYREDPNRYAGSLDKGRLAARAAGAYVDTEVYSRDERDRLPFFAEIIRPQNIRSQLVASVTLQGRPIASIHLCRHGRGTFQAKDAARVAALLPAVSLAQAAFVHSAAHGTEQGLRARLDGLSQAEREVAIRVAQGLGNREIAESLGISPFTVRNRLSRIFDKVGAWSRTELAVWMESAGLTGGWPSSP